MFLRYFSILLNIFSFGQSVFSEPSDNILSDSADSALSETALTKEDERRKNRLYCSDLITLNSIYPIPADPSTNVLWTFAMNLCLSKVALVQRINFVKTKEKNILIQELKKINPLIDATLHALRLSFFVFIPPYNLRYHLLDLYQQTIERRELLPME